MSKQIEDLPIGEWLIGYDGFFYILEEAPTNRRKQQVQNRMYGNLYGGCETPKEEIDATVRRFVASDKLLSACKAVSAAFTHLPNDCHTPGCKMCAAVTAVREAIAKAEGNAQ